MGGRRANAYLSLEIAKLEAYDVASIAVHVIDEVQEWLNVVLLNVWDELRHRLEEGDDLSDLSLKLDEGLDAFGQDGLDLSLNWATWLESQHYF